MISSSSVDLPEPLAPATTHFSPCRTVHDSRSKITRAGGYDTVTPRSSTSGSVDEPATAATAPPTAVCTVFAPPPPSRAGGR